MSDKVATAIAALMVLFFGYNTLDQAAAGHAGGALVGAIFTAVLFAVMVFAAVGARPLRYPNA